jgi:hypothetical protein
MRAELTIKHLPGDLISALVPVLGSHNPAALAGSAMMRKSPRSAAAISYAAHIPGLVVMAWPTPGQVVLYVESSGGRLRRGAGDIWQVVRNAVPDLRPSLDSLVLLDEDANDELAFAEVGVAANLKRPELRYAFVLGIVTAVWLTIALAAFDATGALVLGSIPAILAAVIAAGVLVADSRSKRLVWR